MWRESVMTFTSTKICETGTSSIICLMGTSKQVRREQCCCCHRLLIFRTFPSRRLPETRGAYHKRLRRHPQERNNGGKHDGLQLNRIPEPPSLRFNQLPQATATFITDSAGVAVRKRIGLLFLPELSAVDICGCTFGADSSVAVWKRVNLHLVGIFRRGLQPGTVIKSSATIKHALNTE